MDYKCDMIRKKLRNMKLQPLITLKPRQFKKTNRLPIQIHAIHVLGDISKVNVYLKVRLVIYVENHDTLVHILE